MHETLNIRLAKINDMEKIFNLSNDELVRKNSINKNPISWETHVQWFQERIKNTFYPFYIIETVTGDLVGQVRFDTQCEDIVMSISLCPEFRGCGLGTKIIKMALKKSGFKQAVAYIYDDNISSLKSFEKAGFRKSKLLKLTYEITTSN